MDRHWAVIASQTAIKVYFVQDLKHLHLLKTVENPAGRARDHELHGKKPGTGMRSSPGGGVFRHMEGSSISPHEEASIQFAKHFIGDLEKEREKGSFDHVMIFAEPHFLGKLKSEMSEPLQRMTEWIDKDLEKIPERDLPSQLPQPLTI